jgi:hypothetical protein
MLDGAELRQAESFMAQGHTGIEGAQASDLMEALYRDRQSQRAAQPATGTACLEELQRENARFRKTVAHLVLDKRFLQELAKGNRWLRSRNTRIQARPERLSAQRQTDRN